MKKHAFESFKPYNSPNSLRKNFTERRFSSRNSKIWTLSCIVYVAILINVIHHTSYMSKQPDELVRHLYFIILFEKPRNLKHPSTSSKWILLFRLKNGIEIWGNITSECIILDLNWVYKWSSLCATTSANVLFLWIIWILHLTKKIWNFRNNQGKFEIALTVSMPQLGPTFIHKEQHYLLIWWKLSESLKY